MTSFGYLFATSFATIGMVITAAAPPPVKLVWNASASAPMGLYWIAPAERLAIGDLVVVKAPGPLARFLSERGYLASGVPLMKRVAALPGQRVCRLDRMITIDGIAIAAALERDRSGRDLPIWNGCRIVASGQLFLMNGQVPDSLDGRYFGPLPVSTVIGRATPLLTDDEDGDGRLNGARRSVEARIHRFSPTQPRALPCRRSANSPARNRVIAAVSARSRSTSS